MNLRVSLCLVCGLFLLGGCSAKREPGLPVDSAGGLRLSEHYPVMASAKIEQANVSRTSFRQSVEDSGALGSIRLVRLYRRGEDVSQTVPEYRLFDIRRNSPYAMLGLQNTDVIVGANDYAILNPGGFPHFIRALTNEPLADILVRRQGNLVLLRRTFVD